MIKPLIWNPLEDAAAWLTQRTGQPMNVKTLLDTVINGRTRDPAPTIIKALLPRRLPMAVIAMPGHPTRDALEGSLNHKLLSAEFGALPSGLAYVGPARERVVPLHVNQLLDLLIDGGCEISVFGTSSLGPSEQIWVLPFGKAAHHATPETCGINERDLLALGEGLSAALLPPAPEPEPEQPNPPDELETFSDLIAYRIANPAVPWCVEMLRLLSDEEARRKSRPGAARVRQSLAADFGVSVARVGELIRQHKQTILKTAWRNP